MEILKQVKTNGIIWRVSKNQISVLIDPDCLSKKECHGGCSACSSQPQKKLILKTKNQPLVEGQRVTIKRHMPDEAVVAFIVFGIPILFSIITLCIWYSISPQQAESPIAFISAAAALIAGFGVVGFIDAMFRNLYPPVITSLQEIKDE